MKSATAFKTISEVSESLELPAHVLRFWETKFPQIQPLKRGGGRRYYRPDDIALITRIRDLLHHQGYTIKGVQRMFEVEERARSREAAPASVSAERDLLRQKLRNLKKDLQEMHRTLVEQRG